MFVYRQPCRTQVERRRFVSLSLGHLEAVSATALSTNDWTGAHLGLDLLDLYVRMLAVADVRGRFRACLVHGGRHAAGVLFAVADRRV